LREVGAEAATIQTENPHGAENNRDPVQDDARQMSQAYAVHGRFRDRNLSSDISDGYKENIRPELLCCIFRDLVRFALEYRFVGAQQAIV
jgi:hypothetical protein